MACHNNAKGAPEGRRRHPNDKTVSPKSPPKDAKRAPRDTEEQPRAPEVRPRESPRAPKRKPREPSRARRPNVSFRSRMSEVKIVLPPRRGHDFRCQSRGEGRAYVRLILGIRMAPLEIPRVLRSAHKTLTMNNSTCLETMDCFSSRLISVKPLRVGRFTPCEPASERF